MKDMPLLGDPVVTLEEVRLRRISLSSLDLEVVIRLDNPNPLGITLKELPFFVLCSSATNNPELARGNTGQVTIAARGSTVIRIPVQSRNVALVGALATFVTRGGVTVIIRGTAVIDAFLFSWSVPFETAMPVTMEQVAGNLAGEGK
ncbi:MAG: LEA type 2 family protein [Methanomicrobiales archaeon]|nr:LEA type 2 family protein [Methanomicrobiales archaeon]